MDVKKFIPVAANAVEATENSPSTADCAQLILSQPYCTPCDIVLVPNPMINDTVSPINNEINVPSGSTYSTGLFRQ